MNTWRNNAVVITSKRRNFDVTTSKLRRFGVITTSFVRNVTDEMSRYQTDFVATVQLQLSYLASEPMVVRFETLLSTLHG